MACNPITTYQDVLQNLTDFMGSTAPSPDQQRDARRAALGAYRELASAHNWTLYYAEGLVNTLGPYNTGTIEYQHSSGSYPRQVTLTGGTWPSSASNGVLRVGAASYEIAARVSDTIVQLASHSNPGVDLAAETVYVYHQEAYDLPADFVMADAIHTPANWGGLQYVHPRDWMAERTLVATEAIPRFYSFVGSRRSFNTLCLVLYPGPDNAYNLSFVYKRRPRPLVIDQYQEGTVSVANGSSNVTGVGTSWVSRHLNTVLRFSSDNVDYPTGPAGANVAFLERTVVSVTDGQHLIMDSPADATLAGVKYVLSDPVDVEEGAMLNAYFRGCERILAIVREKKVAPLAEQLYRLALDEAKAGDARTNIMRGVNWQYRRNLQLKNFPIAADQP